jgi:hypothetical protein
MSTAIEISNFKIAAAAIVHSNNGALVAPTFAWGQGFSQSSPNSLHTAAGVYQLVLDGGMGPLAGSTLDPSQTGILVSQNGTQVNAAFKTLWGTVVENGVTLTTLTITTVTANDGAASNLVDFYVELSQQLGLGRNTPL